MDKEQSHAAKIRLVTLMHQGQPWQVAKALAGVQTSQSTAYRLLRGYRLLGEHAFLDGRHGHPSKLRGTARAFLEEQCGQTPQTPSSTIQALLQERFDLRVSVSQINRVRAALGISNHPKSQQPGKKRQEREAFSFNQSGRKALGVSCCLLPFNKQSCFLALKRLSRRISSPLTPCSDLLTPTP